MTFNELWQRLSGVYDAAEAKAVVCYALDSLFGMTKADAYCGKLSELSPTERERLDETMALLAAAVPVQYAVGRADFYGRAFSVAPGVLIPRPETEELCQLVISGKHSGSILDVGTGSGCIAITLALELPQSKVTAWDISSEALTIASTNAKALGAEVSFAIQDALMPPDDHGIWDAIVSNPPYICDKERKDMERNVLEHEPHLALFVPDDNPLLFYRAIAGYAIKALKTGGALYFEINPIYAKETADMLKSLGFSTSAYKDQFGKERFVTATKE